MRISYKQSAIALATGCSLFLAAPASAVSWDKVDLNGYFSFEYEKEISGDGLGDTNGSFDFDLLDLVFNMQVTDNFRIATDITWEHGAASEEDRGNVAVEYGFVEYTFSDLVKFRAGKQFTSFAIYNEIHTAKPAVITVKEPLATNKNNKMGSEYRFYPRWNTGISATGNGFTDNFEFDYIIQLSNGEDDEGNPFDEDSNSNKALNGRFRINPTDELRLGFSFFTDTMNHYDSGGEKDGEVDIDSYSLHMEWEMESELGLEVEYITGSVGFDDGSSVDRDAFSLMLFYPLTDRVTPYFRYEHLDPNNDISKDEANLIIGGVNLLIDSNFYLKLELDRFDGEINNAKWEGKDALEFKASISIGF